MQNIAHVAYFYPIRVITQAISPTSALLSNHSFAQFRAVPIVASITDLNRKLRNAEVGVDCLGIRRDLLLFANPADFAVLADFACLS